MRIQLHHHLESTHIIASWSAIVTGHKISLSLYSLSLFLLHFWWRWGERVQHQHTRFSFSRNIHFITNCHIKSPILHHTSFSHCQLLDKYFFFISPLSLALPLSLAYSTTPPMQWRAAANLICFHTIHALYFLHTLLLSNFSIESYSLPLLKCVKPEAKVLSSRRKLKLRLFPLK